MTKLEKTISIYVLESYLDKEHELESLRVLRSLIVEELKKKEPKPQTIYAGTEDNVEFFKQFADAFGIDKDSYSIDLVDGEYEINVLA